MPATHPMTLPREGTTLVIVDVQERLFPAMDADHREEVMRNIKILATAARRLRLPVVATEQYPKGLGHTLPELLETLGAEVQPVPKVNFSCWGVEEVRARLQATGSKSPILLVVKTDGGHGVGGSLTDEINDTADAYAFFFKELGMEYKPVTAR